MAVHHVSPQGGKLTTLDPIWERIRGEAEDIVAVLEFAAKQNDHPCLRR